MARRQFSVNEVERLIPALERIFARALQLRIALRGEEKKLDRAGVRVSREALAEDADDDTPAVHLAKTMFRSYYDLLTETLGEVDGLGGEVKDLDLGLVDFPGVRDGQEILLCWKLGEQKIGFWHPVDAGYSARRPIDEQVPGDPTSWE